MVDLVERLGLEHGGVLGGEFLEPLAFDQIRALFIVLNNTIACLIEAVYLALRWD